MSTLSQHVSEAPKKRRPKRPPRKPSDLVEERVNALIEFEHWGRWQDRKVSNLYIHVGPRRATWRYLSQRRVKGRVRSAFCTLGHFPRMQVIEARREALKFGGQVESGTAAPGKRQATKFADAFDSYLTYLKTKAEKKGKPARWHANAMKLYEGHIKPEWEGWSLLDMSANPRAVEQWYRKLAKKTPTTAAHCVRLIRACYRRELKFDRALPSALPTSGIELGKIKVQEKAMPSDQFATWRAAWDKIESPVRRGYHLTALLTGARPGELARARKEDWDRKAHTLTLRNIKSRGDDVKDLTFPVTPQIEYALGLALDAPPQTIVQRGLKGMRKGQRRVVERPPTDPGLIFPGCGQVPARSSLPFAGHALRHSWKSLATAIGVPDVLSAILLGHSLNGAVIVSVSGTYIGESAVLKSPELRAAQEKISVEIFKLLGLQAVIADRPVKLGSA